MTDLRPLPAALATSRRADLVVSRHLRVVTEVVPAAHAVVESDIPMLLDVQEPESQAARPADLSGLWFGLCVVVSAVVLIAYDALVGFA